jgi:electron transport complex protein RnfA
MENILTIAIGAILVHNLVLTRFLGLCPFFGVSKRMSSAVGMGGAVTFVMISTAILTWLIYNKILIPFHIEYMRIVVFILVIASFVQFVEMVIRKFSPALYGSLGIYLPLITTNCAVLGVALIINEVERYPLTGAIVYGISAGIGFTLALLLMAGIRERLELAESPPKSFEGWPIAFIVAALLSLAFMGFSGMRL